MTVFVIAHEVRFSFSQIVAKYYREKYDVLPQKYIKSQKMAN